MTSGAPRPLLVVLTGNPNCGKTTVFNALTGLRARVGNYAGVTVERKEGPLQGTRPGHPVGILDLPGTYSLSPRSIDEQIARDVLLHRLSDVGEPDAVVVVVDAANLERNLYYATQVIELGYPTLIALNMMDIARENGHRVDPGRLATELGVPVYPMVASTREGLPALAAQLLALVARTANPPAAAESARPAARAVSCFSPLPAAFEREVGDLAARLCSGGKVPERRGRIEAILLLSDDRGLDGAVTAHGPGTAVLVGAGRERLVAAGVDWQTAPIAARYARAAEIHAATVTEERMATETFSDRLDRVLTHRVWGVVVFVALMALMFQGIFTFAKLPMEAIEAVVGGVGHELGSLVGPGDLRSLLADGVVAGVGAVVVFLPQICLLFLFIGLLEDTGYMARAAFLMDRVMSKVGLHGKSFIPMLSSFACAIPGILATRTIETPKDRLVTLLVAPLMSCSARLPVYTLLIAACVPDRRVLGFLPLPGLTLLAMYILGTSVALAMAWLFKRTLLRGHTPLLLLELPPYKWPTFTLLLRHMWDRSREFLRRAGTVILGINILLWFLASYPRDAATARAYAQRRAEAVRAVLPEARTDAAVAQAIEQLAASAGPAALSESVGPERIEELRRDLARIDAAEAGARLRGSFAGWLGRAVEPMLRPLGFDWKIGVGILASFAAREVFVSTIAVVYNVDSAEARTDPRGLAVTLREQRRPDGTPVYDTLTGITLMVFYVLALQCASTVAVVRRETNSWTWPVFQWAYLGVLAWIFAFVTYQGGRWLGLGP
jgi:ferrous iron transport protein B